MLTFAAPISFTRIWASQAPAKVICECSMFSLKFFLEIVINDICAVYFDNFPCTDGWNYVLNDLDYVFKAGSRLAFPPP